MKPFYDKSSLYSSFTVENKSKDPKFKVVHHVKIPVYKKFLQIFINHVGPKKISLLKKIKIL